MVGFNVSNADKWYYYHIPCLLSVNYVEKDSEDVFTEMSRWRTITKEGVKHRPTKLD